jgi:hypothetical protein
MQRYQHPIAARALLERLVVPECPAAFNAPLGYLPDHSGAGFFPHDFVRGFQYVFSFHVFRVFGDFQEHNKTLMATAISRHLKSESVCAVP